ncbi:cation diffusion facilitator family transporter [Smaragdicoccus niigatensis]|uniref:cation diffusion facilitator family transporter n=1 Tax=Smaragdicoccus niigatensis TaxID=359359 RepID=UPI0003652AA9
MFRIAFSAGQKWDDLKVSGNHGDHDHDHGGSSHTHGATADSDQRWLGGALAVLAAFMAGEVIVGIVSGSLALISDAAHMLTDAASIALAMWTIRLAQRPASGRMTYGWKRAEILSAQANGVTLLILAAFLGFESIRRLFSPSEVTGVLVLVTALVGVVVNIAATWMISRANRTSLNIEGAFQHILNDLFAFIATAIAGVIILVTGFARADSIASLIVVVLMIKAGVELVAKASRVFLEAAPKHLDPAVIGREMVSHEHVVEVHDLHIWEITSGSPALSAHVLLKPGGDSHGVRVVLAAMLLEKHGIDHTTLQVEVRAATDLGMPGN